MCDVVRHYTKHKASKSSITFLNRTLIVIRGVQSKLVYHHLVTEHVLVLRCSPVFYRGNNTPSSTSCTLIQLGFVSTKEVVVQRLRSFI